MLTGDDPDTLRALCNKCRCLARGASNAEVSASLAAMAADYERAAQRAEAAMRQPAPRLFQSAH
jgi:hypothetical protein